MKKGKFLSSLAAAALSVSMLFAPVASVNAAQTEAPEGTPKTVDTMPTSTTVNVWKLQADSYNDPKQWDHNGGELTKSQKQDLGTNVRGLEGVEFSYYNVNASQLKKLKDLNSKDPTKVDEASEVNQLLGVTAPTGKLAATDKDGKSTKDLENGNYWFIETKKPVDVTTNGGHAVPFALTLPQVLLTKNSEGNFVEAKPTKYLSEVNVYPKNTTTVPKVDKDFKGSADAEKPRTKDAKDKDVRDYTLGDDVPYEIQTIIPAKVEYGDVYWSDAVTSGLSLNVDYEDVTVTIGSTDYKGNNLKEIADITPVKDDERVKGFELKLNEKGRKLVNNQPNATTVSIKYTATLNENSVVDIPETNDVTFHYGRTPSYGNTPQPNKTNDKGEIEVTKTWGTKKAATPKEVQVQLVNASTGKDVGTSVKLNSANNYSYKWENLDRRYEYKVVEVESGYDVVYGIGNAGEITLDNNDNDDNPAPLTPDEPHVVQHGKRFVKADKATNKSLEGAEFVIKVNSLKNSNSKAQAGQYLALKTDEQTNADRQAYLKVRGQYEDMVKAGTAQYTQAQVDDFYASNVIPAYKELKTQYKWVSSNPTPVTEGDFNNTDNLVVLKSGKDGRFEIDGLPEGNYSLVEVKAPEGYALPSNNDKKFDVTATSFNTEESGVEYKASDNQVDVVKGNSALRVDNTNLTIPQTGGIGSLIFILAGLALMGVAFVAMRRRNSVEA